MINNQSLYYFTSELKKEATFVDWVSNLDPATVAALTTMVKMNLTQRYGKHIPVLRDVLKHHYVGLMHAGLKGGLEGKKGPGFLGKAVLGALDFNTPGLYENARAVGETIRGTVGKNVLSTDNTTKLLNMGANALAKIDHPITQTLQKTVNAATADTAMNRAYDTLFSPVKAPQIPQPLKRFGATAKLYSALNSEVPGIKPMTRLPSAPYEYRIPHQNEALPWHVNSAKI